MRSNRELRVSEERYKMVSDLISDYAYAMRVEPSGKIHSGMGHGGIPGYFRGIKR